MTVVELENMERRFATGTCALLGLNPKHLTLTQKLRVSRASALRLQIDDLEKAQLLGQPIDIQHELYVEGGGDTLAAYRHDRWSPPRGW